MINTMSIQDKVAAVSAPEFLTEMIESLSKIQGHPVDEVAARILQPYASGRFTIEDQRSLCEIFSADGDLDSPTIGQYTEFLKARSSEVSERAKSLA